MPTTMRSIPSLIEGKCDICCKKDGYRSHKLRQCITCQVLVHEVCYGIVPQTGKRKSWECLACSSLKWKAVDGVRQQERPVECELCNVKEGIHAMHPLYDTHGKKGKHMVLSSKGRKKRLAWVHSLCAFYIGSNVKTNGCVYSCDKYGNWGGPDEEENKDDHDDTIHHFVIADDEQPWKKKISDCRKLKCVICGLPNKKHQLVIPVQCTAGNTEEIKEFRCRHANSSKSCNAGLHVGCARWMGDEFGNQFPHKRVFFYPGSAPGAREEDAAAHCYCNVHATEIAENSPKKILKRKQQQLSSPPAKELILKRKQQAQELALTRKQQQLSSPPAEELILKRKQQQISSPPAEELILKRKQQQLSSPPAEELILKRKQQQLSSPPAAELILTRKTRRSSAPPADELILTRKTRRSSAPPADELILTRKTRRSSAPIAKELQVDNGETPRNKKTKIKAASPDVKKRGRPKKKNIALRTTRSKSLS